MSEPRQDQHRRDQHRQDRPRFRIRKLQLARRAVQALVLVSILVIPALARYNNYLSARQLDKVLSRWDGTFQGEALAAIDAALRVLPGGEVERAGGVARNRRQVLAYARSLRGGPWSAEIGALSVTDPLAAAESLAASKRGVRALWISLAVPLLAALLLGRVFCSWICPMGLVLEWTDRLRGALRWLELGPYDVQVARWIKYVLLALGLLMAAALSLPILGHVYPPAVVGRELHGLVFGLFDRAEMGHHGIWIGGLTWMSAVLIAIILIEVAVSRRWWCRSVCPGGALYSLLGWRRPVRVERNAGRCTLCGECDRVCHLGLGPMQDEMGPECDNCGLCISACDDGAIDYVIRIRERRPT